jgi:cytochrome c-type biogenesis protein
MEEWIQQVLASEQAGITVLAAVFLLGIISVFTCGCNVSILGIVVGYSGSLASEGRSKKIIWSGIYFLLGMIVSMSVIGGLVGYASELISDSFGVYWKVAAGIISVFFGLWTMDLLPFKMPGVKVNTANRRSGRFSSLIFGLTIGGLTLACSTCCNPVFPIVLAASFVKGSFIWGILLLFMYALGYGLTFAIIIVGVGLGFGTTSRNFAKFAKALKIAGGLLMIFIGFFLLLTI